MPEKEPVRRYYSLLDGHKKAPAGEFNSVGVYRTFFDCEDLSKRRIISFLGVCSCLHLYLNGRFVGYSEESHNTAEFDLSGFCIEGRNELVAVVHRWCTGSYLECQDMFRNNGIFRDVLLREDGPVALWDLNFTPTKRGDRYDALVELELSGGDTAVTITLRDSAPAHEARLLDSVTLRSVDGKIVYPMKDLEVTEWNAEQPVLYELTVSLEGSAVAQKVGFKEVSIRDQVFCLNGRPVKLLGVNHHDTDPENGWCMKPEEILRDLKLAKQYNCNTIRTSHYAPDPLLIELAAELGLYLVDECDLETHGVPVIGYGTKELPAFYTRHSGFSVDYEIDTPEELARVFRVQNELGFPGGMLVTNPIPEEYSMDGTVIAKAIDDAIAEANALGIRGKETTPFLLAKIKELTGGDSLASNIQLVFNNARLAARTAAALSE